VAMVTPYVVTKKTVFKWQEGFWTRMKEVFDKYYREKFKEAGLLDNCGGELQHLISDAATMQIIRWTSGGFGMASHNYDGDMLTDEIAQVHRSPGFITSNLIGKKDDGTLIKAFEASHGTAADLWEAHLRREETSLNPLGMMEALLGAMVYSTELKGGDSRMGELATRTRGCIHRAMASGNGTRDLSGPSGLTTEQFVDYVAEKLSVGDIHEDEKKEVPVVRVNEEEIDYAALKEMFQELDTNNDGVIQFDEFVKGVVRLNVQPRKIRIGEEEHEKTRKMF